MEKKTGPGHILSQFSVRLKGLAKARGFSRSNELLSPRQELEKWSSATLTFSRLGKTSLPERDGFSLKIGARHLSDSSCSLVRGF